MSTVTIGVTCYNHARFIDDCLMSCLAAEPDEIRVFDDASTDGTWEVVNQYAVYQERAEANSGNFAAGLNRLIATCRTDYLLWISGDDMVEPCAAAEVRKRTEDYVYGDVTVIDENGAGLLPWTYASAPKSALSFFAHMRETYARQGVVGLPLPALAAYRMEWLRKHHLRARMFDGLQGWGDTATLISWFKTNPSIWRIPRPLIRYRRHLDGETFTAAGVSDAFSGPAREEMARQAIAMMP